MTKELILTAAVREKRHEGTVLHFAPDASRIIVARGLNSRVRMRIETYYHQRCPT